VSITAEPVDVAAVRERNRQRANEVRLAHSRAKRWIYEAPSIETSRERAAELFLDPPPHTASMRVFDVLCAARRTGPVWARRVLATHRIYERKPVGSLTLRQALVLAAALRDGYPEQMETGA
jgi:hypothetical protein